jgi:hypothetical protein
MYKFNHTTPTSAQLTLHLFTYPRATHRLHLLLLPTLLSLPLRLRTQPLISLPLSLQRPLPRPPPMPQICLPARILLKPQLSTLNQPPDAPVLLPVRVVVGQAQNLGWEGYAARVHAHDLIRNTRPAGVGLLVRCLHHHGRFTQAAAPLRVLRIGERVILVEDDTDILAVRVTGGIPVVFNITRRGGVDGKVAAHDAVFTGPPEGAVLLVDDVSGDDELVCYRS